MVLLISPHTVVKRNYYVNNFTLDTINKLEDKHIQIYSQGSNIANMLKILQTEPYLLTFFGGVNGKHVKNYLHVNKIKYDSVHFSRNTYEKINIIDNNSGNKTTIKDFYVSVDEKTEMQYINKIKENFKRVDLAVIDDRLPYYISESGVRQIYDEASKSNVRIFQDVKTALDLEKIENLKPYCVKFNKSLLDRNEGNFDDFEDIKKLAQKILSFSTKIVIIDMLLDGAYMFTKDFYIKVESINIINKQVTSDSTDALLAGFVNGIAKKYEYEKTLKLAYASEIATLLYDGIEKLNRKLVHDIKKNTKITLLKY